MTERSVDALIVPGSEPDVCVLSTVLDAVDLGYRLILVRHDISFSGRFDEAPD
ncbi:MAG: isochorismatase family protein [Afipia sp.]|nr:isochorismatase family protein [Afipia sp.]